MSELRKVVADMSLEVVGVLGRPLHMCTARQRGKSTTLMHVTVAAVADEAAASCLGGVSRQNSKMAYLFNSEASKAIWYSAGAFRGEAPVVPQSSDWFFGTVFAGEVDARLCQHQCDVKHGNHLGSYTLTC